MIIIIHFTERTMLELKRGTTTGCFGRNTLTVSVLGRTLLPLSRRRFATNHALVKLLLGFYVWVGLGKIWESGVQQCHQQNGHQNGLRSLLIFSSHGCSRLASITLVF